MSVVVYSGQDQVKLKIFPNPMRDDGVFVAEDRPIEPYSGVHGANGEVLFQAVPQGRIRIMNQLPRDFAEELVRRWNSFEAEI
jgi:hypothetical protein